MKDDDLNRKPRLAAWRGLRTTFTVREGFLIRTTDSSIMKIIISMQGNMEIRYMIRSKTSPEYLI